MQAGKATRRCVVVIFGGDTAALLRTFMSPYNIPAECCMAGGREIEWLSTPNEHSVTPPPTKVFRKRRSNSKSYPSGRGLNTKNRT